MDPLEPVRFVKHGCVCFESDDTVVYVDPYKVPDDAHDADLIVITHSHGDHYSPEDIERVRKEDTCFATTAEVARLLERDFGIDDDYISELSFEAPASALNAARCWNRWPQKTKTTPSASASASCWSSQGSPITSPATPTSWWTMSNATCCLWCATASGTCRTMKNQCPHKWRPWTCCPGLWCRTTTAWTHPPQRKTGRGCAPRSQPQAFLAGNGKRGCSDTLAECRVSSVLPRPL